MTILNEQPNTPAIQTIYIHDITDVYLSSDTLLNTKHLKILNNPYLKEIQTFPEDIEYIELCDCYMLEKIPKIPKCKSLTITGCPKLDISNLTIPNTIIHLDLSEMYFKSPINLPINLCSFIFDVSYMKHLNDRFYDETTLYYSHPYKRHVTHIVTDRSMLKSIIKANNNLIKLKKTYYMLKCKNRLRRFLYEKVLEKHAIEDMHPSKIENLLLDGYDPDDIYLIKLK